MFIYISTEDVDLLHNNIFSKDRAKRGPCVIYIGWDKLDCGVHQMKTMREFLLRLQKFNLIT